MSNASIFLGQTLSSLGDRLGTVLQQRNAEERQRQREDERYALQRGDSLTDEKRLRAQALDDEVRLDANSIASGLITKGYLMPGQRDDPVAIQAAYEKMSQDLGGERAAQASLLAAQATSAKAGAHGQELNNEFEERRKTNREDAVSKWESNDLEIRSIQVKLNDINTNLDTASAEAAEQIASGLANETPAQRDTIDAMAIEMRRAANAAGEEVMSSSFYRMEAKQRVVDLLVQQQMMGRFREKSQTRETLTKQLERLHNENQFLQNEYRFVGKWNAGPTEEKKEAPPPPPVPETPPAVRPSSTVIPDNEFPPEGYTPAPSQPRVTSRADAVSRAAALRKESATSADFNSLDWYANSSRSLPGGRGEAAANAAALRARTEALANDPFVPVSQVPFPQAESVSPFIMVPQSESALSDPFVPVSQVPFPQAESVSPFIMVPQSESALSDPFIAAPQPYRPKTQGEIGRENISRAEAAARAAALRARVNASALSDPFIAAPQPYRR